jgi:hypothetical protein
MGSLVFCHPAGCAKGEVEGQSEIITAVFLVLSFIIATPLSAPPRGRTVTFAMRGFVLDVKQLVFSFKPQITRITRIQVLKSSKFYLIFHGFPSERLRGFRMPRIE